MGTKRMVKCMCDQFQTGSLRYMYCSITLWPSICDFAAVTSHISEHGKLRRVYANAQTQMYARAFPAKNRDEDAQPACSIGPPTASQRNAIRMAFRWRADDGLLLGVYEIQTKSRLLCPL